MEELSYSEYYDECMRLLAEGKADTSNDADDSYWQTAFEDEVSPAEAVKQY